MVGMAAVIVLASFFIFLVMAADLPPLNDGSDHGDPPYLTESGWKPLLNGKDLSGWELADPNKKGKWLATSAVIWGGVNNPTSLVGVANSPGDRIVKVNDQKVKTWGQFMEVVAFSREPAVRVAVERDRAAGYHANMSNLPGFGQDPSLGFDSL